MKDNGKAGWFILSAAIVIAMALFTYFPGNAIHNAPTVNKIIGFSLLAMVVPVGLSLAHDWISLSKDDKRNYWAHVVIMVALAVLGFCTLIVWHSGPIGSATNNL